MTAINLDTLVLDAIRNAPATGIGFGAIESATGGKVGALRRSLERLRDSGKITMTGTKRGAKYHAVAATAEDAVVVGVEHGDAFGAEQSEQGA